MAAATTIIAVLGFASTLMTELIARDRPLLVAHGITTRELADSRTALTHPTHVQTASYRVDTHCVGTYCVEQLKSHDRVLIGASAALAALKREVSEPGHERDTDATEVVLPQASVPGFLSVYRLESDYTMGAAHAHSSLRCETYATSTGKRVALRDVVGIRAANRIVAVARAALADPAEAAAYTAGMESLLVPKEGTVVLCGDPNWLGDRSELVTVTVTVSEPPPAARRP